MSIILTALNDVLISSARSIRIGSSDYWVLFLGFLMVVLFIMSYRHTSKNSFRNDGDREDTSLPFLPPGETYVDWWDEGDKDQPCGKTKRNFDPAHSPPEGTENPALRIVKADKNSSDGDGQESLRRAENQ